jgi:hypothetical protein
LPPPSTTRADTFAQVSALPPMSAGWFRGRSGAGIGCYPYTSPRKLAVALPTPASPAPLGTFRAILVKIRPKIDQNRRDGPRPGLSSHGHAERVVVVHGAQPTHAERLVVVQEPTSAMRRELLQFQARKTTGSLSASMGRALELPEVSPDRLEGAQNYRKSLRKCRCRPPSWAGPSPHRITGQLADTTQVDPAQTIPGQSVVDARRPATCRCHPS